MYLTTFAAGPWQTNCYLVGAEGGSEVVVIDPGVDAIQTIDVALAGAKARIGGVLLTHGHLDHVASAADVAERHGVGVWIHADDRELLTDAGPGLREAATQLGVHLREPADVRLVADGDEVEVAGLTFRVHHAPGHRPGAVIYELQTPEDGPWFFSGDVLFAGSVGRVDLPGGDAAAMSRTLAEVVLALPDKGTVLPGHGPHTTIGAERATNPYLKPPFLQTR